MSMLDEKVFYDFTLPDSLTASPIRFGQVTDPNPKAGVRQIAEIISGNPYVVFTGIGEANPDFTLATKDLHTLLSMFIAAYADDAANGFMIAHFEGDAEVGYQKMKAGSTRFAPVGTEHDIHTFLDPTIYLQGISAQQDGDAVARARVCPLWDGTNPARQVLTGQALNTTLPDVVSLYTLGPIKLNGTWITGEQSVDVGFDLGFVERRASGQQLPTFHYARQLVPRITATTKTTGYLANVITAITSLSVYFRQRKENDASECWADNQSKHIKLTASAGSMVCDALTGSDASTQLTFNVAGAMTIAVDQQIT
jgi:hypothetical protein